MRFFSDPGKRAERAGWTRKQESNFLINPLSAPGHIFFVALKVLRSRVAGNLAKSETLFNPMNEICFIE